MIADTCATVPSLSATTSVVNGRPVPRALGPPVIQNCQHHHRHGWTCAIHFDPMPSSRWLLGLCVDLYRRRRDASARRWPTCPPSSSWTSRGSSNG